MEEMGAQGVGAGKQFGRTGEKSYPRRFGSDQAHETNLLFELLFRFGPVLAGIAALPHPEYDDRLRQDAIPPRGPNLAGDPPILPLVADVALQHDEVRHVAVSLRQNLRDRPTHLPDR